MKLWQRVIYVIIETFTMLYGVIFQHVRFRFKGYRIPKGPIFVLSNHHSNWDPLYLAPMFYFKFIRFIAHDELFQNWFYSFVIKTCLGQVRRGMDEADPKPIFELMRIAKKGGSIGLFPEGDIDMFGQTLPFEKSVAKLAKSIKLPVVLTRITGAHIRAPRWRKYPYASKITYSVTDVIKPDQIASMSLDELYQRIYHGIHADEMLYQRHAKIVQIGFDRAKWLELGLFMCPQCKQLETLTSKNNDIYCSSCSFSAHFNRYSFFSYKGTPYFTSTPTWDAWQRQELIQRLNQPSSETILTSPVMDMFTCMVGEYFTTEPVGQVVLTLQHDCLCINNTRSSQTTIIPFSDLKYAQLRYKDVLEIRSGAQRYRFSTKQRIWSAYLWKIALNHLMQPSMEEI